MSSLLENNFILALTEQNSFAYTVPVIGNQIREEETRMKVEMPPDSGHVEKLVAFLRREAEQEAVENLGVYERTETVDWASCGMPSNWLQREAA